MNEDDNDLSGNCFRIDNEFYGYSDVKRLLNRLRYYREERIDELKTELQSKDKYITELSQQLTLANKNALNLARQHRMDEAKLKQLTAIRKAFMEYAIASDYPELFWEECEEILKGD